MPNHCENDLYIRGSEADVQAVLDFVGMAGAEPKFDFDKIIPYPQQFKERDESASAFSWSVKDVEAAAIARKAHVEKFGDEKDGYNSGGYDWCCKNWGTKWNAYELALRPYGGTCVTFQTAWSPPIPVIVALAKQFPGVSFHLEYFERGMAVAGGISCLSKEDWYEEKTWEAGAISDVWETQSYHGHRGG